MTEENSRSDGNPKRPEIQFATVVRKCAEQNVAMSQTSQPCAAPALRENIEEPTTHTCRVLGGAQGCRAQVEGHGP
jgi:hypothetical protein